MHITTFSHHKQLFLDLNLSIPFDLTDREAALILLLQNLDYSRFSPPKQKSGRPPAVDAYTMLLILTYARTQGKFSSRDVERLCTRDLFLVKVLDGRKAPDHCTVDRFIHTHNEAIDELFSQTVRRLGDMGELTKDVVYQDGTKIESKAGRYTFVWKKTTKRDLEKLSAHIKAFIPEVSQYYRWDLPLADLAEVLQEIKNRLEALGELLIPAGTGRGHRLTPAQRFYQNAVGYLEKLKRYRCYLASMEERNSMSKTDPDATFMRLKDDHMRNGQLKPAYNLQVLVDGGYTVGAYASADRTDYATMIPALTQLYGHINWTYRGYCADSGYDSQQNFEHLEQHQMAAYIKPQTYEQAQRRKCKQDIGRRENMTYDESGDYYVCAMGKKLVYKQEQKHTNQYGYGTYTRVYQCRRGCVSCSQRDACMKRSKGTYKRIQCNQRLERYHQRALELITSAEGTAYRVNRSIQAEGVFAQIKANWGFRRFLHTGMKEVYTEWILVCLAMNAVHLGNRLKDDQVGTPFRYTIAADSA